jgi:hypothetical protein
MFLSVYIPFNPIMHGMQPPPDAAVEAAAASSITVEKLVFCFYKSFTLHS